MQGGTLGRSRIPGNEKGGEVFSDFLRSILLKGLDEFFNRLNP